MKALSEFTVPELKGKAKALEIEGADSMKKKDLIEAIQSKQEEMGESFCDAVLAEVEKTPYDEKELANHPKFDKFKK